MNRTSWLSLVKLQSCWGCGHVCDGINKKPTKQKALSLNPAKQVYGFRWHLQHFNIFIHPLFSVRVTHCILLALFYPAPPSFSTFFHAAALPLKIMNNKDAPWDKTWDDTILPGNFNCFDNSSQASEGQVQQCSWQKCTSALSHWQEGGEVNSVFNVMKNKGFFPPLYINNGCWLSNREIISYWFKDIPCLNIIGCCCCSKGVC